MANEHGPITQPSHVPVTYDNGETSLESESQVIMPEDSNAEYQRSLLTGKMCGNCASFHLAEGQRRMDAQQFIERLVREDMWQTRHLGAPPESLGICGQHESGAGGNTGSMITSPMTPSCPAYQPDNGKVRR